MKAKNVKAVSAVDLKSRFWQRVSRRGEDQCWPWVGSRQSDGYGRMEICGKARSAHRLSYEIHVGPIPDGKVIDHTCQNKLCVNPSHLEAVSPRINAIRHANQAFRSGSDAQPISGGE